MSHTSRALSLAKPLLWLAALTLLLAACTQVRDRDIDGGGGGTKLIESFAVTPTTGDAPLLVTAEWKVADGAAECMVSFGDGSTQVALTECGEGSSQHTYTEPGTYTAKLSVERPNGTVEEATVTVTVTDPDGDDDDDPSGNHRPVISGFTVDPSSGKAPLDVTFSWSASDPDGDVLVCTLFIPDGSAPVVLDNCGSGQTYDHTFQEPGEYEVVLTVTDGNGGMRTQDITVTVTDDGGQVPSNSKPTIGEFVVEPTSGAVPLTVNVSWTAQDADGDVLTCTVIWGDGTPNQTVASCAGDQQVSHTFTKAGSYTVRVMVTDGNGGVASSQTTVTASLKPTAVVSTGSSLLVLDSGDSALLDAVVGGLLGTDLEVGAIAWQDLLGVDLGGLELLDLVEQVTDTVGWENAAVADLPLVDLLFALVGKVGGTDADAANVLNQLLSLLGSKGLLGSIKLGDLIKTGDVPLVELEDVLSVTRISLLDLVVGTLQLYNHVNLAIGDMIAVALPLDLDLDALTAVKAFVSVTRPPELVLAREGATFSTAGLRLELIVDLDTAIGQLPQGLINLVLGVLKLAEYLGVAQVQSSLQLTQLGLYLDIAPTTGEVKAIDPVNDSVIVELTPGLAELRLGWLDDTQRALYHAGAPLGSLTFGHSIVGGAYIDALINADLVIVDIPLIGIDLDIEVAAKAAASATGATKTVTVDGLPGVASAGTSAAAIGDLITDLLGSLDLSLDFELEGTGLLGSVADLLGDLVGVVVDVIDFLLDPVLDLLGALPLDSLLGGLLDPILRVLGVSIGEGGVTIVSVAGE